jgi:hypothetical protein
MTLLTVAADCQTAAFENPPHRVGLRIPYGLFAIQIPLRAAMPGAERGSKVINRAAGL